MDAIVVIMFASVICVMTSLAFLEVRRIRKLLELKQPPAVTKETEKERTDFRG